MSTISTEERREVARRLRGQANKLGPNMDAHEFAHYTADVIDVDECMTWYEMELRLADLIEPSEPKVRCVAEVKIDGEQLEELVHDAAVELTGIDRDALLALADEMDRDGKIQRELQKAGERWFVDGLDVREYARRIRAACGEVEPCDERS